jgi:hypothetical protein
VDKARLRKVSSEYLGFFSQFSLYQIPHSYLSSGAGTIGQLVADLLTGMSHFTRRKKITQYKKIYSREQNYPDKLKQDKHTLI